MPDIAIDPNKKALVRELNCLIHENGGVAQKNVEDNKRSISLDR